MDPLLSRVRRTERSDRTRVKPHYKPVGRDICAEWSPVLASPGLNAEDGNNTPEESDEGEMIRLIGDLMGFEHKSLLISLVLSINLPYFSLIPPIILLIPPIILLIPPITHRCAIPQRCAHTPAVCPYPSGVPYPVVYHTQWCTIPSGGPYPVVVHTPWWSIPWYMHPCTTLVYTSVLPWVYHHSPYTGWSCTSVHRGGLCGEKRPWAQRREECLGRGLLCA